MASDRSRAIATLSDLSFFIERVRPTIESLRDGEHETACRVLYEDGARLLMTLRTFELIRDDDRRRSRVFVPRIVGE
jgi:hypothetical protein